MGAPAISVTRKLNLGLSHSRGPLLHQFYYTAFPKRSAIATEISIRLKVPCGQQPVPIGAYGEPGIM